MWLWDSHRLAGGGGVGAALGWGLRMTRVPSGTLGRGDTAQATGRRAPGVACEQSGVDGAWV